MVCKVCGYNESPNHYINAHKLISECLCFGCSLWNDRVEEVKNSPAHSIPIIDGVYYSIDDEDSKSVFRGFAGARFQIEFNDGYRVISTNLWCGGDIPEIWRDKLPNNARFENNLKWTTLPSGTQILCEQKLAERFEDKKIAQAENNIGTWY